MMQRTQIARQAGFTLVEIMVVVVILGLLATVGTVAYTSYLRDAQNGTARTRCAELESEVERFTTIKATEDISADDMWDRLVEDKKIKRKDLRDPWGEEFQITTDDEGRYVVFSKGRDKQPDTDDDVYRDGIASERQEDF